MMHLYALRMYKTRAHTTYYKYAWKACTTYEVLAAAAPSMALRVRNLRLLSSNVAAGIVLTAVNISLLRLLVCV